MLIVEKKMPIALEKECDHQSVKRQYEKPAIAEEESYETCATLACGFWNPPQCPPHDKKHS
jgi:hypothetical protein